MHSPDASSSLCTQFITDDGTDTGKLVEMRRFYIQARGIAQRVWPGLAPRLPAF